MFKNYTLPISVKGIVFEDDKVWLRLNERNEWELPGGRLEPGEQPEETVIRELYEELGFNVIVSKIIQAHTYTIHSKNVLIITYLCSIKSKTGIFELMGEAGPAQFKQFLLEHIAQLNMPEFYKNAIFLAQESSSKIPNQKVTT